MIDENEFIKRVNLIDWKNYYTAYGKAIKTPYQLIKLASSNHKEAMDASHDLWCGLCHQHAYVSSAALPSLPFILEILRQANEELTVEILDIILGFSVCTNPIMLESLPNWSTGWNGKIPSWLLELRKNIVIELPLFYSLQESKNKDISDFAKEIIEELEK